LEKMSNLRTRIITLVVLMGVVAPVQGQTRPVPDEPVQAHPQGDAAISRLKSPFCPGLMLEVCSHPDSKILRDTIQAMAQEGASADSLVAWMLGAYGEEYRAVPRAQGGGLLAWIVPPLVLAGGLLLVVLALRTFRARRETGPTDPEPLSEEDEAALKDALDELKAAEEVPF
jgi:cytochrome c-type biogenesis protein CcmH/NrfF